MPVAWQAGLVGEKAFAVGRIYFALLDGTIAIVVQAFGGVAGDKPGANLPPQAAQARTFGSKWSM